MTYREKQRRRDWRLIWYMIGGTALFCMLAILPGCAQTRHPCEDHVSYGTPPYDECVEFYDYWSGQGEKVIFVDPVTGQVI